MLHREDFIKLGTSAGFFPPQVFRSRKNKTSRGFSYNSQRQKLKRGYSKKESSYNSGYDYRTHLKMNVYGTADILAAGNHYYKERLDCPCCGSKSNGKFLLSDSGRRRLKRLKMIRGAREAGKI